MVVTGLALYALYEPRHWFYRWFMPLNDLIGIPYVRLVHLIGMWCFIIFAMIHVYLSILPGTWTGTEPSPPCSAADDGCARASNSGMNNLSARPLT